MSNQDERRTAKRFLIKTGASFILHSSWPDKGILVDISKGGLAFLYHSETPWPDDTKDGCMVFGEHDSCLSNIPATVVADHAMPYGHGNTMLVRRRSVKFGALSPQQKFLLECFIWINSTAQC